MPEGRANYHQPKSTHKPVPNSLFSQPQPVNNVMIHKDMKINIPDGIKRKVLSVDQDEQSFKKERIEKTIEALKGLESVLEEFEYPEKLPVESNILILLKQI